jgi:hypothetical protein
MWVVGVDVRETCAKKKEAIEGKDSEDGDRILNNETVCRSGKGL